MTRLTVTLIAVLLGVSGTGAPHAQQADAQAEKLLASAQHKATVEGDLKGAIEDYKKIIAGAGTNRRLAAQALVEMAECYQKLGDTEWRQIYARVLRDFADHKDLVVTARARLGRAESAQRASGMSSRQVWTASGGAVIYGTVSHDGRYLPYSDWARGGDLLLHDLTSGATREIDNKRSDGFEFAELGTFSPDDRQLAYGWFNKDRYEIRVVGLQAPTAAPRVLFSNPEVPVVSPEDWSPDGKWLAVQLQRRDKTAQIGLVAVQDGTLRVLKSVDWRGSTKLFFSPDGRYLAYDRPATDTSDQRDVFVLAVDGSRETPAVEHPSNDVVMGWSPNGSYLLFTSDRTGSTGLWAVEFARWQPQGSPQQIKADVSGTSLGLTSKGTLYTLIHHSNFTGVIRSDIHVAPFDFAKGQFLSTPVLAVQTFVGANNFPAWSPDGKYLAFLSQRGRENPAIGILSHNTEQFRELRPGLKIYVGQAPLRWSPDGLSLAIPGTDSKGRQGIFRIDVATGEATPIALSSRGPVGEGESFNDPMWAPDGKRIYYRRASSAGGLSVIVERDLSSGNEKEIFRRSLGASWNPSWMFVDLSPDGKYLATVDNDAWPGHNTGKWNVFLIPVSGDGPKELMRGQSQGAGVLMWAPDSRSFFVYSIKDASTRDREVWRVAVDGTESQKLGLNVNSLGPPFNSDQQFHVHPDGRRVVFAASEPAKPDEVWALENFLPAQSAKK